MTNNIIREIELANKSLEKDIKRGVVTFIGLVDRPINYKKYKLKKMLEKVK